MNAPLHSTASGSQIPPVPITEPSPQSQYIIPALDEDSDDYCPQSGDSSVQDSHSCVPFIDALLQDAALM